MDLGTINQTNMLRLIIIRKVRYFYAGLSR
jgi:hypothetical protein